MRYSTLLLGFALLMACGPATYSDGRSLTDKTSSGDDELSSGDNSSGSNSSGDNEFASTDDDVSSDITAATSCGPASCSGCCQAGKCIEQPTGAACGVGGQACVSCQAGGQCVAGQCQAAAACNATTWPNGCCASDGTFQAGTAQAACGTGGEACATCGASEVCLENKCTVPPPTKKLYRLVLMHAAIDTIGVPLCAGPDAYAGWLAGLIVPPVGFLMGIKGGVDDLWCDPVAKLTVGGQMETWSDFREQTNSPTWDDPLITAEDVSFKSGVNVQLFDSDTLWQFNLCTAEYTPTDEDFTKSEITVPCVNTGITIGSVTFRFSSTLD